jgi:hypothetical protein
VRLYELFMAFCRTSYRTRLYADFEMEAYDVMRTGNAAPPRYELHEPDIAAPMWPWTVAGWTLAALLVLTSLLAWAAA